MRKVIRETRYREIGLKDAARLRIGTVLSEYSWLEIKYEYYRIPMSFAHLNVIL